MNWRFVATLSQASLFLLFSCVWLSCDPMEKRCQAPSRGSEIKNPLFASSFCSSFSTIKREFSVIQWLFKKIFLFWKVSIIVKDRYIMNHHIFITQLWQLPAVWSIGNPTPLTYYFEAYLACSFAKLCLTLCDPMDCCLLGSSVHGILQAKILSGLPFPSPGDPRLLLWQVKSTTSTT